MKLAFVLLITSIAVGQNASKLSEAKVQEADLKTMVIPAGTKVPLALKQAISTKSAKEGDPVYAETTFPFVVDNRIIIPAGTYVQGRISHVQRPGRVKGRAELLMHFTSMIYPSGYTVVLPGSVDNMPGADKTSMKDSEGTIRQDGQKAKISVKWPAQRRPEPSSEALQTEGRVPRLEPRGEAPWAWR